MLKLTGTIGNATDNEIAERLHDLEHAGAVEYVMLGREDTQRHRLRALTDRGTELAIVLARDEHLENGSVLLLEAHRAVVVRMAGEQWLSFAPRDTSAALELGYFAGNMHWKVRFEGTVLHIVLDGPEQRYLERLEAFLADGRIRRVEHERD